MSSRNLNNDNDNHTIAVMPTITDDSMRNKNMPRTQAEALLREMGSDAPDQDDIRKNLLSDKHTTKEESTSKTARTDEQGFSTFLIIIFALIVITLVCLIVWMVLKYNESKSEEDDLKARLHPHPRNNMMAGIPPELQRSQQQAMMAQHAHQQALFAQQQAQHANQQQAQAQTAQQSMLNAQHRVEQTHSGAASDQHRQDSMLALQQARANNNEDNEDNEAESGDDDAEQHLPPMTESTRPVAEKEPSQAEYEDLLRRTNAMMEQDPEINTTDRQMLKTFNQEQADRDGPDNSE